MKVPIASNGVLQENWISTSWNAINSVVRAHHTTNISFFHTHLKWLEECLQHVLLSHLKKKIQQFQHFGLKKFVREVKSVKFGTSYPGIEMITINPEPIVDIISSIVLATGRDLERS